MHWWWRRTILTPLLLGLLALSCDPAGEPLPAPTAPRPAETTGATGQDYSLVEGRLPEGIDLRVSRVIGSSGGELYLLGHSLRVPAGAVAQPTLFVLAQLPDGYVQVELRALAWALAGVTDVGEQGFPEGREVTLSLSYAWAVGVDDPDRLRIAHQPESGALEPLPSRVHREQRVVTAELKHFSRYCLATD